MTDDEQGSLKPQDARMERTLLVVVSSVFCYDFKGNEEGNRTRVTVGLDFIQIGFLCRRDGDDDMIRKGLEQYDKLNPCGCFS
eukprot:scaffold2192_cov200-Alexandrium_tamarense.AAC.26